MMRNSAISRRRLLIAGTFAVGAIWSEGAGAASSADGEVILTVKGRIPAPREFTLSAFEELGLSQLSTRTPWDQDPVAFQGVRLNRFREALGISGNLRVTALNDYSSVIPAEDTEFNPILATRRAGVPLSIRDKGPLFLVYPFDEFPQLSNEAIYARCVWQITRIDVM